MRKVLILLLGCVMLFSLAACTGFQGEGISSPSGDGISGIVGDGLRDPANRAGGGARTPGISVEETRVLSGTYKLASDPDYVIAFRGNRISFVYMGENTDDYFTVTYTIDGNYIVLTTTLFGETETERVEFYWVGSDSFMMDGELFIK